MSDERKDAIILYLDKGMFTMKQCFFIEKKDKGYIDKIENATIETLPLMMLQAAKENSINNFILHGNKFFLAKIKEEMLKENMNKYNLENINITIEE